MASYFIHCAVKKSFLSLLIILQCFQLSAQSYIECADNYYTEYNKVTLQKISKFIEQHKADSILLGLEADLDNCLGGKEITDFKLTSISGKTYTNESLKGKVVMLNFWSTHCAPCIGEISVLNKIHNLYKQNENFILISILVEKEEELNKLLFAPPPKKRFNIDYEIIPNSKALIKENFKLIKAYPTNLFLDKNGKIILRNSGGIIDTEDADELEQKLKAIIDMELNKNTNGG